MMLILSVFIFRNWQEDSSILIKLTGARIAGKSGRCPRDAWTDNMSSYGSEMDEETHRFKQYESFPVKAENYGKQREIKLDKSHHDSLSGLSKRVMMPRESGERQHKSKMLTQIRHYSGNGR
jgi:hypothetical protein